jgi:hypothetical protein
VDSPPRIKTKEETESKMAIAFQPFEQYIERLATGKLDGYLDSIRHEDKVTLPGLYLPKHTNILLHDLGKYADQGRINKLFIEDTVFVASAQL